MNYKDIVTEWNKKADIHNQWEDLGEDEKVEFAFSCGRREESIEAIKLQRAWDCAFKQAMENGGKANLYRNAFSAACVFIDAHVGDPDMTDEMCKAYAAFQKMRKFCNPSNQ